MERDGEGIEVHYGVGPILDIHVIVNTLAVVFLSSAVTSSWFLPSAISYVQHAFTAYQAVERIVFSPQCSSLQLDKPKCLLSFF
jgi:hypothetical protein